MIFMNLAATIFRKPALIMKVPTYIILIANLLAGCAVKISESRKNQLAKELKEMVETDQIAAYIPQGKYKSYSREQWHEFQDSVFTGNKGKVEAMFNKYGFPGYDKVGTIASKHFWLLVQHCDKYPAFQRRVLRAMAKEVAKKNANPSDFAYLYDRVQVNAGEKQLFGTQVTYETQTTGRAIPKIGLADPSNVERLRKEYNLEPLKDYLNLLTTAHFEMNREHYEKMGVSKPVLY